jgi:hypothetical protein
MILEYSTPKVRVTHATTSSMRESRSSLACALRAHFKTWYDRCGVSVKRTVFYVGFLQCGSALVSLRYPNVGFEMRS